MPDIECVPELVTATKLDHESRGVAQHDPTEGRTIGAVSSHSSASSVVCRICQLTEKETGASLCSRSCSHDDDVTHTHARTQFLQTRWVGTKLIILGWGLNRGFSVTAPSTCLGL